MARWVVSCLDELVVAQVGDWLVDIWIVGWLDGWVYI